MKSRFASHPAKYLKEQQAQRKFEHAQHYWSIKERTKACEELESAIRLNEDYAEAYSQLGEWYFEQHEFAKATRIYSSAYNECTGGRRKFCRQLVKSLLYSGQPYRALEIININNPHDRDWDKSKEQAYFIQEAIVKELPVSPLNLGLKINTQYPELFPDVSIDSNLLYFTRRVNNMDDDLFRATMEDSCDEWKSVVNFDGPINSSDAELSQFISADGHYLFYTRCENRSENGWANGGCDLFMAYRVKTDTEDWTVPQSFGSTINTPDYEGMPSLSPDNRELFFVSDRPGGYGGLDIWISRFENGVWQLPVNAGRQINTSGNETAPFIDADNRTLYFTSDGLPGMGGNDIFVVRRLNDTDWTKPTNLGYPINTAFDEMSACVTTDGKKMYFASDRNGPAGNYDLYITPLPGNFQPVPVRYLEGYVYDSLTKERLNYAQIFIENLRTGDTVCHYQSNRGDGSFIIILPTGNSYIRHTVRMAYTDIADTFTLENKVNKEPLVKNTVMLPFDYQEIKPIFDSLIATVHFDLNRTELTDSEKSLIHHAVAPWIEEKGIVFYINGYTDNTGTPLINEELSYKRASLVTKEMVSVGVPEVLTLSKGWGESKMIATNETDDGRKINRRVEIIVKR